VSNETSFSDIRRWSVLAGAASEIKVMFDGASLGECTGELYC
jgi:hypothetical protein